MPGPWSRTITVFAWMLTSIGPSAENLAALSTRLSTARSNAAGCPSTAELSAVDAHVAPGAAVHPIGDARGDVAESDGLERLGIAPIGGQLDQLVDQRGQLAALAVEVGDQPAALVGVETVEVAQHRDVGAQAGQRGAQLVAGVLHELGLLLAAALQRPEHPAERAAQPGRLVGPVGRHVDVEAAGRGDHAGGLGEAFQPAGELPTDQPADDRRSADGDGDGPQRVPQDRVERGIGLGQGAGQDDRPTRLRRHGEHAVRHAVDLHVVAGVTAVGVGHLDVGRRHPDGLLRRDR